MAKKIVNEGLFGAAKKFSDAFFDGLKNDAVDSVISQAKRARMEKDVIEKMEKIKREKQELDAILAKIPQAKK